MDNQASRRLTLVGATALSLSLLAAPWAPVPQQPSREEWTFRQELAKPAVYHARTAYRVVDAYGLKGETETVRTDLDRFLATAPGAPKGTLTLAKGKVDGPESYRIDCAASGDVTVTAEDDDGIRRAVCHFEDRNSAGDLKSVTRKPWLKNRISRCFFGPIKRPPFNRDELMDDMDYYPDEYLNRLAHEGVNGLWLTIELRNIVETSFNARDKDAPRRIAKLRRTVDKCRRYGIRTWIFCIEPRRMEPDSPILKSCPELAKGTCASWEPGVLLCPSKSEGRRYLEEAFADLFRQVPGLPGVLNISHGERPTTCMSLVDAVRGTPTTCPLCSRLQPWQIHWQTAEAIVKGMRAANPEAEFLSWFYQPYVQYERAPWVAEVAGHLPDGVTMLYNFESGAVKEQLGRYRAGGDYWLSYAGPSPSFEQVAEASRAANGKIGAKIQVGCSHECATVPFVPVPGLLYRKYVAMKKARCTTVMQCWYFGNHPGVMNKAAGELAFSDLTEGEDEFLLNLAKPEWGEDAPAMARLWRDFSDAYALYPLSNDMQYYGPLHAGVAWPMLARIEMAPLGRTWKPTDPPSGDAIGESLENHTLAEASILVSEMRDISQVRAADGSDALARLEKKYAADTDRRRDLGVIRALQLIFASGADILEFYRLRENAVCASRFRGDFARARRDVAAMRAIVGNERRVTETLLPLVRDDSRLGFHSEAEAHQFHPALLEWRLNELKKTLADLDAIDAELAANRAYPLSDLEKTAPAARSGQTVTGRKGLRFTVDFLPDGDIRLAGEMPSKTALSITFFNTCGTTWPLPLSLKPDGSLKADHWNCLSPGLCAKSCRTAPKGSGYTFDIVFDRRSWNDDLTYRPAWMLIRDGGSALSLWPEVEFKTGPEYRLNIGCYMPNQYGRLLAE